MAGVEDIVSASPQSLIEKRKRADVESSTNSSEYNENDLQQPTENGPPAKKSNVAKELVSVGNAAMNGVYKEGDVENIGKDCWREEVEGGAATTEEETAGKIEREVEEVEEENEDFDEEEGESEIEELEREDYDDDNVIEGEEDFDEEGEFVEDDALSGYSDDEGVDDDQACERGEPRHTTMRGRQPRKNNYEDEEEEEEEDDDDDEVVEDVDGQNDEDDDDDVEEEFEEEAEEFSEDGEGAQFQCEEEEEEIEEDEDDDEEVQEENEEDA